MTSAHEPLFKPGQLVWARVKGFPLWPARVIDESEMPMHSKSKKKSVYVKFFGPDTSSAACASGDVLPYFRHRKKYSAMVKRRDFMQAVQQADEYVEANPEVKNFEEEIFLDDNEPEKPAVSSTSTKTTVKLEKSVESAIKQRSGNTAASEKPANATVLEKLPPKKPEKVDGASQNKTDTEAAVAEPTKPVSKRSQNETQQNTHSLKRPGGPINGDESTGSSMAKRHIMSPPSIRLRAEFQNKKIGFIGVGTIGSRLVRRLLQQNFRITIYDRSFERKVESTYKEFAGLPTAPTAGALMEASDIVFSCVYDADAAKEIMFNRSGDSIINHIRPGKAYVELTTLDPSTAIEFFDEVASKGGRFLEAPLSGMKKDAEQGSLIFLCAGDKSLFDECGVFFQAIGRRAVFFGDAGNGAKFRLCHQMLAGVVISAVSEVAAVGHRCGLSIFDLNDVIGDYSPMGCPLVKQALKDILEGVYEPSQQLGQMQKELQLALNYAGYEVSQPTLVTSAANQLFTMAKRQGEEMNDSSAVYRMLTDMSSSRVNDLTTVSAPSTLGHDQAI